MGTNLVELNQPFDGPILIVLQNETRQLTPMGQDNSWEGHADDEDQHTESGLPDGLLSNNSK